jgi:beta-glucanase (GH16 family)
MNTTLPGMGASCVRLLLVFLLSITSALHAASITWTGTAGDGAYATAANWQGGVAPANNDYQDTAVFNSGARTVTVPASRKVAGLSFLTAGWTLSAGSFSELTTLSSSGSGTNTLVGVTAHAHATWTINTGNTVVLPSLYERDKNITLTGGGTLQMNASIGGYSGTAGTWGIHIVNGRLRFNTATPYTSGTGGAVFINGPDASLELPTTITGANSLIGAGRIVDQLGDGLAIDDIGGGYVKIYPLSELSPPMPGNWQLQFEDNFDGTTLDGAKWRLGQHWPGMAGTAGMAPENITVSNGKLQIKSEQRSVTYSGTTKSYASGEVSSFVNFRQQHGYFEARVKYPAVTGLWPAFWLMPDRGDYGWKDGYFRSYVKFDLTAVSPGTINTAELKVKVSALEAGTDNNVVFMKVDNDSWTESTLTWNNAPVPNPVWIAQRWNQAVVGQDMTINVKDFIVQQMAGDKKISFALADTFMKTRNIKFHSSEAVNQADRPRLVINGVTYYATEDGYVRWGTLANNNYGSTVDLVVEDSWGDTATTFNGGMEIDIMESLGIWGANETSHAAHWDGYGTQHQSTGWHNILSAPTGDGFHTYGLYWQPGLLEFYVDGIRTASWNNTRVMSVPAYMILSLQLGGWDNNNAGPQVHNQIMEVDWVRVWSGTRTALDAVIVDNTDTANVTVTGTWTNSTSTTGYFGSNYVNDGNIDKGTKIFSFKPPITVSGNYLVYARWTSGTNRATNVPIDIVKSDGSVSTVSVNQQAGGAQWNLLGTYSLSPTNREVRFRTTSTNGYVIADSVCVIPAP